MTRAVRASAPGKVIIVGEHFVVRDSLALVAAIDRRVKVNIIEDSDSSGVIIESNRLGEFRIPLESVEKGEIGKLKPESRPFAAALREIAILGYSLVPHKAVIDSSLPTSAGLGSSAATLVSYVLALTALLGDPLKGDDLFKVALAGEAEAHGKPSGIDVAISVWGGIMAYRRDGYRRHVESRLGNDVVLIVADTGVKRRTRDVVEHVITNAARIGVAADYIYRAADALAEIAVRSLEEGDADTLGLVMNVSQGLLEAVGASSRRIAEIVYAMRGLGVLGAKLTGAGWGGCVVGLVRGDPSTVIEGLKGLAPEIFPARFPAEGARLEVV